MKSNAAVTVAAPNYAIRDSATGIQVEVPFDAQGKPDFFVAGLKLRKLQDQNSPMEAKPAPDKAWLDSQAKYKTAKAEYKKAADRYNAALASYEKAKLATDQAKNAKAKPATIAKLEAAEKKAKAGFDKANSAVHAASNSYEAAKRAYEKELKARHKAPAYDYATASWAGFGKKYPKQYGTPFVVALQPKAKKPEGAVAKTEKKIPTKPPATKAKVVATPKPVIKPVAKAAPVSKPTPTATPKPAAPPKTATVVPPTAKPTAATTEKVQPAKIPGLSKEHPISYSLSEVTDGKILIHTCDGKTLQFPQATSKYESHGGGLGSIQTADGHVFWFRYVPVEDLGGDDKAENKPEVPVAKIEAPASPSNSATASFSGVSDAEAADYTVSVKGYPTAKAPMYVWKHKNQELYLAVFDGKRVKLNQGQFLSLDQGAHPEYYAKGPKPLPKKPVPDTSPEF